MIKEILNITDVVFALNSLVEHLVMPTMYVLKSLFHSYLDFQLMYQDDLRAHYLVFLECFPPFLVESDCEKWSF